MDTKQMPEATGWVARSGTLELEEVRYPDGVKGAFLKMNGRPFTSKPEKTWLALGDEVGSLQELLGQYLAYVRHGAHLAQKEVEEEKMPRKKRQSALQAVRALKADVDEIRGLLQRLS